MSKEINNAYTFDLSDMGKRKIVAKYKELEASIEINIIGPNLRSTEETNVHLFLKTSDGQYLCVKE